MNIFILDDHPIRVETYTKAFQGGGHTIRVCRTAGEGINALEFRSDWDIFLLEHDITGTVKGLEFVLLMPSQKERATWPFAIVTTTDQDAAREMVRVLSHKCYSATWMVYGRTLVDFLERLSASNGRKVLLT